VAARCVNPVALPLNTVTVVRTCCCTESSCTWVFVG